MFEGVVASLLNKLIGKYVDNLDSNQLSISVWKGLNFNFCYNYIYIYFILLYCEINNLFY